jgi:hypothetical protein
VTRTAPTTNQRAFEVSAILAEVSLARWAGERNAAIAPISSLPPRASTLRDKAGRQGLGEASASAGGTIEAGNRPLCLIETDPDHARCFGALAARVAASFEARHDVDAMRHAAVPDGRTHIPGAMIATNSFIV